MSIFKIATISVLGAAALVGGSYGVTYSYAAVSGNQEAKSALESRDFEAFKKAIISGATKRAENLTQDEFNKMADGFAQKESLQKTIDDNNYEEFKRIAGEKVLNRVNSQEEFNKLVEHNQKRKEYNTRLEEVVRNSDFDGYKKLLEEQKQQFENNNPRIGKRIARNRQVTDEQLKTRFDRLVEQYKQDGQLPGDGLFTSRGGLVGHDRMMGGRQGHMMGLDSPDEN